MLSVGWIMTLIMPLIVNLDVPFLNNYKIIGERFVDGIKIIPLIITAHIFYAMYIINMPSIYLCNKQNWSPILRMIGAGVNLLLNVILIPKYNIYGAAFATAAGYGIMFFVLFYKNKMWLPIKLMWSDILIFSLFILCSIVTLTFNMYGQYIMLIVTLFYMLFLLYKHGLKNIILLFK
jgi:O-antigen/teichoic acid export membrane protein